jgi:hypothetical protein
MNKAFTRETDREDDDEPLPEPQFPGGKNYITRAGYDRLRAELFALVGGCEEARKSGCETAFSTQVMRAVWACRVA